MAAAVTELASGKLLLDEPAPHVTRLRISNPAKRGALDHEILDALAQTVPSLDARCLIITGTEPMFSAGYDLGSEAGVRKTFREFDRVIGLDRLAAIHLNDSKTARGSRVDRHEHIGKGTIGNAGFKVVVNHPHFAGIPKILETPKGKTARGADMDSLNLRRLCRMLATSPIKQPKRGMHQPKRPKARPART